MLGAFLHICTCTCTIYCGLWPLDNTTCLFPTWYQSGFSRDRHRQFAPASVSPVPVLAAAALLSISSPCCRSDRPPPLKDLLRCASSGGRPDPSRSGAHDAAPRNRPRSPLPHPWESLLGRSQRAEAAPISAGGRRLPFFRARRTPRGIGPGRIGCVTPLGIGPGRIGRPP
jgi:hypothetical protein